MAESIDDKVNGFPYSGRVDNVFYNENTRFLRLELRYNNRDVEIDGCKGSSYIIKSTTYQGDEIDVLLTQFSLPSPTQLLGKPVSIYLHSQQKYEIRPLE